MLERRMMGRYLVLCIYEQFPYHGMTTSAKKLAIARKPTTSLAYHV